MSEPLIESLVTVYLTKGACRYEMSGAHGVSQLQHALQTAAWAERAGAPEALIVAALLHDLGHLMRDDAPLTDRDELDPRHDDLHQYVAIPFLRGLFDDAVLEPIKLHVDAKRYLCAVDAGYWARLSDGSKRSLELQGGAFSGRQVDEFLARPGAMEAVSLRRWDDQAKDVEASVPPFEYWVPLLRRQAKADSAVARG